MTVAAPAQAPAWPDDLSEQVGKMVSLFSSPNDGEALASVRALERTLAKQGLDLHALAAFLVAARSPAYVAQLETVAGQYLARVLAGITRATWTLTEQELALLASWQATAAKRFSTNPEEWAALLALEANVAKRAG